MALSEETKTEWRKDIQSLRGLAIINMFLFRMKNKHNSSQLLGTEIFFAISGYLTTMTLDHSITIFSLKEYAIRRIKRIVAPYYITLLFILICNRLFFPVVSICHFPVAIFQVFAFFVDYFHQFFKLKVTSFLLIKYYIR